MALSKLFQRIFFHNNTTPALNEDNLNAMSKGLSDVDDRLIDLAGTIMEDVPVIQHDLEILEPAIENIDANVTRAETAADNAEEEALKSEGYAVGTQDGVEVTSGEYYQNNAKYYAEIANPPIENTVDFTDIITISDAINKAAKDVKLKVEAVQDLHGFDKPWVGGAGKNKLRFPYVSTSSGAITIKDDGQIVVNGTLSERTYINLEEKNTGYAPPSGTWIISKGTTTGSIKIVVNAYNNGTYVRTLVESNSDNVSFTVDYNDYNNLSVYLDMAANQTLNVTIKPMIRASGTSDTWESYTNICPLTGWDNAKVTRAVHNLGAWTNKSLTGDASYGYRLDNGGSSLIARVKPNTSYVASRKSGQGNRFRIVGFINEPSSTGSTAAEQLYSNNSTNTYTFNSGKYNFIVFTYDSASSIAQDTAESMIKLATDTDPTYEPYQGKEITISLNGTRYGATIGVTSGVLTVTKVYDTIDGSKVTGIATASVTDTMGGKRINTSITNAKAVAVTTIADIISDKLPSVSAADLYNQSVPNVIAVHDAGGVILRYMGASTLADAQTALNDSPVHIVYELATPITVQLTAEEIDLLYGYNTLFGDCGDISLTYDASGIIHIEEAKLDTETLKTIAAASSDFADFKARIAAL